MMHFRVESAYLNSFKGKGYVIAPAGYGKTYLIAQAVKSASSRQLILTHTFAGVNSIKVKLTALGVPAANYHVDTIASWSLSFCLAYPKAASWVNENPTGSQWDRLYECCAALLEKDFIRRITVATYSGVYVDEYQDCSDKQHEIICKLANIMPCRILGDPLQAIFDDINKGKSVNWATSIYPHFANLGQLETPWRWINAGNPQLGKWLNEVRSILEQGRKIDLQKDLPTCVKWNRTDSEQIYGTQSSALYKLLGNKDRVIGLYGGDPKSKNRTHNLAGRMGGKYSSIEEVEGTELHKFIRKLATTDSAKNGLLIALEFAKNCFNRIENVVSAGTKRGEVTKQSKTTKYPLILHAANHYLHAPSANNLKTFFMTLRDNPESTIYRRDLLNRLLNVLTIQADNEELTLLEAANIYQREMRHKGRPIKHKKLIGTTLLVKGLEYDHAVILDADSLDVKNFYVAITRGAKSITIISTNRFIP